MSEAPEPDSPLYTMRVDLSVLESLGINLYSNAAAVLSELVANAYDADAGEVRIKWQRPADGSDLTEVVVSDDGVGMTVDQLNERFLTAGYKKRDVEGTSSAAGRPYMGRKGIGKLSVFSLARSVRVYSTVDGGQSHGLEILVSELQDAISAREDYHPTPVDVPQDYARRGTFLVLSDLKKKRAELTANALRKRLARRFDVLDTRSPAEGGFHIFVNDKRITFADRQELKRLEFIWEFVPGSVPDSALPPKCQRFALPSATVDVAKNWTVGGWFGTTKKPTDLVEDEEAGSLKNIIVLARKRPIQEGIIEKLDFSRIFGNYVTGQIEADFLDLDDPGYDDIATSDRQRLIEDDERVIALQEFLRRAFVVAADQWSEARPSRESKDALIKYPRLKEWVADRPEWQRASAEQMIGTIAGLPLERKHEEEDRTSLLRSGVLAFERIGLRKSADDLENLSTVGAPELLNLLGQQDAYESGLWVDILRSRVGAVDQLRKLTRDDEKEKVLQEHLYKHLWLLDPSWERATGSETMEQDLRHIAPELFALDESGKQIYGRIDIRYATVSGRHVIVELKRYSVKVEANKLAEQGVKYVEALASILRQQGREAEVQNIEVVFVLGKRPGTQGRGLLSAADFYASTFSPLHGSFQLYDQLIYNARNQYDEYLKASEQARELDALLSSLEAGAVAEPDDAEASAVLVDESVSTT